MPGYVGNATAEAGKRRQLQGILGDRTRCHPATRQVSIDVVIEEPGRDCPRIVDCELPDEGLRVVVCVQTGKVKHVRAIYVRESERSGLLQNKIPAARGGLIAIRSFIDQEAITGGRQSNSKVQRGLADIQCQGPAPVGIDGVSAVGNGNGVGGRAASIDVLNSTRNVAVAIRDENTRTGERNRSIRSAGKDLAIGDKSILAVQAGHTVLAYRRGWLNAGAATTCGRQQTSGCRESEEQAFHRTPRSACF